MSYPILDAHCDALLKLWMDRERDYLNDPNIDANFTRLNQGNVKIQLFAIFIEPDISQEQKFQAALEQVDLFYQKVIKPHPNMKAIRSWSELDTLEPEQIGAVLTLEGLDAIGNDLTKLRILYQLGVRSIGMTWNQANLCADGVGEARGAGLTELGKAVVQCNNEAKVLTDVSHLSINGFWDVIELADYPIASHSNAFSLCAHPRNLNDEQIKALVKKNGFIGVVFHPHFLTGSEKATIIDVIDHIDYLCSLGAEKNIGFGSDFDGIDDYVEQLRHAGEYQNLLDELAKYYSDETVRGFAYENFKRIAP